MNNLVRENAFNASQPCGSDAHNGCDKCEPGKYDNVEIPTKLAQDIVDLFYSNNDDELSVLIDQLDSLIMEQGK